MTCGVALWSDSTYAALDGAKALKLASDLSFPLENFVCAYGAGLVSRGNESYVSRAVAETVVIEMGYNDDKDISAREAVLRMRRQAWYKMDVTRVHRVIFIEQPSYHQVAGKKKNGNKGRSWEYGEMVHGSKWNSEAVRLLKDDFNLEGFVLKVPAERLFAGFIRDSNGALWQDAATCRSYASYGEDYSKNGLPALWSDAWHPSARGAENHFRLLVAALQSSFEIGCPLPRQQSAMKKPTKNKIGNKSDAPHMNVQSNKQESEAFGRETVSTHRFPNYLDPSDETSCPYHSETGERLPPGWRKVFSSKHLEYYYVDMQESSAQWNPPSNPQLTWERIHDFCGRAWWFCSTKDLSFYENDTTSSWCRWVDDEGRAYWSDAKTGIRFFEPSGNNLDRDDCNLQAPWDIFDDPQFQAIVGT